MPDQIEPSTFTYDEWVEFFFDRPIISEEQGWSETFLSGQQVTRFPLPAGRIVENMTRCFKDFAALGKRFSQQQLDQGLWVLLCGEFCFTELLWDEDIPLSQRIACIEAMYYPFKDYVAYIGADVKMECIFNMWWDLVCDSFWWRPGKHKPPSVAYDFEGLIRETKKNRLDPEAFRKEQAEEIRELHEQFSDDEAALHETLLRVLKQILLIGEDHCTGAAMHGLGHLHHPEVPHLVGGYMLKLKEEGHDVSDYHYAWLLSCANGTVM